VTLADAIRVQAPRARPGARFCVTSRAESWD
jgi:hypothetical protein